MQVDEDMSPKTLLIWVNCYRENYKINDINYAVTNETILLYTAYNKEGRQLKVPHIKLIMFTLLPQVVYVYELFCYRCTVPVILIIVIFI